MSPYITYTPNISFSLANTGDEVLLLGPTDQLVDGVAWGTRIAAGECLVPRHRSRVSIRCGNPSITRSPLWKDTDNCPADFVIDTRRRCREASHRPISLESAVVCREWVSRLNLRLHFGYTSGMTSPIQPVIIKTIERFRSKQLHNQRGHDRSFCRPITIAARTILQSAVRQRRAGCCPRSRLAETLAALIAHHEIEPIIVVAIHATRDRLQEYGTAGIPNARGLGKKARKYSFFVLDEVLPYINRRYRTLTGPVNTAIMGFSLGGLMAFDLAWNHPDVFGAVGRLLRLVVVAHR